MEKSKYQNGIHRRSAHRGVALLLLFTILISLAPTAMATMTLSTANYDAAGFSPAASASTINDSSTKVYIKTSTGTTLLSDSGTYFAGEGTWIQLKAMAYFKGTDIGRDGYYTIVYYNNIEYNTSMDDIYDCVQSEESLLSYIKGTLWTKSKFDSLKESDGLKRDIRVHALQLALKQLGYLSDTPDGSFGPNTTKAVKAFQKSQGLTEDGYAGNDTQSKLYSIALGGTSSSSSTTSSGGTGAASISPSTPKTYVQLGANTNIFKTATTSTGTSVPKGTVLQLVANKYYTGSDGKNYMCLYYSNVVYNVLASDISSSDVMTTAQLTGYVINTLWTAQNFVSLNDDTALLGDVRVHGLQYALQLLGYYTGAMDGNFGSGTKSAVRAFQSANKLTVDGRAGPLTQKALYALAISAYNNGTVGDILYGSSGSSSGTGTTSGTTGTTGSSTGTLITLDKVNLRKSASTSGVRLAVVPKSTTLTYTDTATSGGVTWYKVVYGGRTGWLMGTFVNASGSSSSSSSSSGTGTSIGTITITKPNTRVRKTANGVKTGTVLSIGSQVPYYSQTSVAGYTWYYILTPSGIYGYVRGDCATVSSSSSSSSSSGTGTVLPSSTKTYISLSNAVSVFITEEKPAATGAFTTIPAGAVIQMVSTTTYTRNSVEYCSVYYNNTQYNAVYADVINDIMTNDQLITYITGTLWKSGYTISLKETLGLKGDIRVHSAQLALSVLGYYTGAVDGTFGSGTTSAVRNFQRQNSLTVDGSIGPQTWVKLFSKAISAYTTGGSSSSSSGDSSGGTTVASFGNVTSVEKANWSDVNNNAWFPKSSAAAVMDVKTGQVFTIYRWSGGSHADCVPYAAADTKTMCDIVGFSYNSSHPSTSKLNQIIADSTNNNTTHAWPDFPSGNVGSAWDRRPGLLNVNGRVFCVSIYGWPHGMGDSSFRTATRNGTKFYELNNYYGMMCVHFVGSTTHTSSTPNAEHQAAIQEAYTYAKGRWPSLCK